MTRHLIWPLVGLSKFFEGLAKRCGYEPPVAQLPPPRININVTESMRLGRMGLRLMTEEAVNDALSARARTGRDQGADNDLLWPLNKAINESIEQGDYRLAAEIFRENYALLLAYQSQNPPCEMHKGAPTFNVARAYLRGSDFFAAMHYFELSQKETRLTEGNDTFNIYTFDLFKTNFWDTAQLDIAKHPIPIYQEFWGIPFDKDNALDDYAEMSPDSKLAYIIASAERVRLQQIEDHSGWDGSEALRLGYWTLAADLARLLEVESKIRYRSATGATVPDNTTIVPCLEQGFTNTAFGNLSHEMLHVIRPMFPRQPTPPATTPIPAQLYETHFDGMLTRIRDKTVGLNDRVGTALYLLGFTRNQVAHKIDKNSKLFQQLNDAKFLVDLFLTLCRTKAWKPL